MSRRSPLLGLGFAWACLLALLILPATAAAAGSPAINLAVGAPTSVLYGANATVTLTASNPAAQPYGYNLSYRAVLPEGISYVAGSGHTAAGTLEPQIIANEPATGKTTLIFANVSDLSPASSNTLTFQVKHSTSHYTIGNSYTVEAGAYIAEAARYLAKFSATGVPEGPSSASYTGYATGSASSTITALEIAQAEESPQGEILRGVHDHQVTYKLTVTNTSVGATGKVIVDDWLPADLEYLGCGGSGADHTTDAPTNSGSAEEYPGSGPITVPTLGGCLTPAGVETIETDPDPGEEDPTGVYTNVSWSLGTLAPGETRTIEFRAAVPLRENTTTWPAPAGEPTVSSGDQAANLNNNSGKETTDGESVITFAKASGDYTETLPVSASDHLKRVAKDLIIEKSASSKTLAVGQVTTWTLTLRSSEYRYNTDAVVTDTVPNGLCPLSSTNLSNPVSTECEPDTAPSSPYFSAVEEANGTWKLVWNKESDATLAEIAENASTTITYSTRTRVNYQHEHKASTPILADDTIANDVLAQATTNVVCGDDTDCSGSEKTPINHERPLSEAISAESSASQSAAGPSIAKEIAKSGTACLADEYTTSIPIFHPGDLVCWRLIASFPTTIETKGLNVTDFLPIADTFDEAFEEKGEKAQARGPEDTLPGTTFNHSEASSSTPGGSIAWALPDEGHVTKESQRFERVYATIAGLPHEATSGELQGNLMKFANVNTPGASFSYRAEAGYALQFPQLSLTKDVVKLNGGAYGPASTATVKGGDKAEFALTVSNAGELEAINTEVWDVLPNGLQCGEISAITDGGSCASGRITWGDIGLGQPAIAVAVKGQTVLNFVVTVPTSINPATVLEDHAGVVEYHSATNTGGEYTYVPAEDIDATIGLEANVPAANAQAKLETEAAVLEKTHTSSVVETGNSATQATIGELVTFEVSVTLPAGTAFGGEAKITDPGIPTARLIYEKGSAEALLDGSAAPAEFKVEEVSASPVLVLPDDYTAPSATARKITLRFKTRVANVNENNAAGNATEKSIPNTAKIAWTNPITGAQTLEAKDEVPLVEPAISITESNNATGGKVHGTQIVEYKLKPKNASTGSTAFDTKVVETVPAGLSPCTEAGKVLAEGEETASKGVWNATKRTITWEVGTLTPGAESSLAYFAVMSESPVANTKLTDKAIVTTASLPATEADRRTAENDTVTGKPGYEAKVESTLEVEGSTIKKKAGVAKATIGEHIAYTVEVTLPAHVVSYDETVIDVLPSSLDFDEYVSAECVNPCSPAVTPKPYTPKVEGTTTTVAWFLGNIEADASARTIKLVYRADVRSTLRGGSTKVVATNKILNTAGVYWDKSQKHVFEEGTIPTAAGFEVKSESETATTEVIEPNVTLVKEAAVGSGAYGKGPITVTDGNTVHYKLKIANTGAVAAYGVEVKDALPAQLTEVKTTTNSTLVTQSWSEGKPEIRWKLEKPVAPNSTETIELGYEAKLVSVTKLEPGQKFTNAAAILTPYFGVPEAERNEKLKNYFDEAIEYREYTGPTAAVEAKVALPTLTIEKLVGASGVATSANAEVNQPFTWRVVIKNTSTTAVAKKLDITDKLPPNWEYVAGSAEFSGGHKEVPTEAGTLEPGKELTWSTSIELAAGASTTLTYLAKPTLAAETTPGIGKAGVNSASATVLDAAENPEDVKGLFKAGPATAQGVLVVPVLEVTKTPAKASVPAGENDSYKIHIHNSGGGVAREVLVADTLPGGMSYKSGAATASPATGFSQVSDTGSNVSWSIASIAAGATVEVTVPIETESTLSSGTELTNKVTVSATAAPTEAHASGTIDITNSADVSAEKHVISTGNAVPGHEITYEVAATNKGPSLAREVKLVDKLPSGLTYVSSTPECEHSAGTITCVAGNLAVNQKASFQIKVQLAASLTGTLSNTVTAESLTPDPEPNNNKATAETVLSPEADLSLLKTAPETVITGEELTWTLTAKNNGPSAARGVTVIDPLPAGASYLSSTPSQGSCAQAASTVTCKLEGLAVGASATITITARVTAAPGALTNTATVGGEETDPEPANNKASATSIVTGPPTVLKASDSPEATIGHRIGYTLTVTIPAHAVVYGQTVIDTLPDTLDFDEYVSASCTSGCTTPETAIVPQAYTPKVLGATPFTTSVAWYLGNVTAASTARTVVLVYRANVRATPRGSPAEKVQAPAEIKNSAALYYNKAAKGAFEKETIPTPGSFEHETAAVSTTTKVIEPSVEVLKEASVDGGAFSTNTPFEVTDGDTITYRLKVTNSGTAPACNVSVTDALPASGLSEVKTIANAPITSHEAEVTKESASELAWTIPALGTPATPGKTITLEYTAKLAPVTTLHQGQEILNTAKVPTYFGVAAAERTGEDYFHEAIEYRTYVGNEKTLTAKVALPVLTVTKTPLKASVAAGEKDTYTIVVENIGTEVAHEVLAEDTLPAGMTYKPGSAIASPTTGFSEKSASGSSIVWEVASIAPGASVEIKVPVGTEASLASGTELENSVAVHAPAVPIPVEAKGKITLTTSAELQASKSASANPATPGGEETYTISVLNKGPSVARSVKLIDPLPAGTVFKSADMGCLNVAGTVECAVGELAPNAGASYKVTVSVESSVTTPILNTVEATSTTPDPEPKNSKASVEVDAAPEADLSLEKIAPAYVITGEELTWTLTVKNEGPSDAKGVTVVDPLPAGTVYQSSKPSQGKACEYTAGQLTCDLEGLADEASATVTVTAKVTAPPGPLTNTATVSGEEPDPHPEHKEASATTTVLGPPSIAKASDSPEATIGHRIGYTLTVTIPAHAVVYGQTVIDTLPDSLDFDEYVSAECTSGCTTPETAIVPQTYAPKVLGSAPATTSVAWYLGNLTAAPAARTVVLTYRASVREAHRTPPNETVKVPAEIENSATLYYNQTSKGSFEEANIPAPGSFDQKTSPVSTSTKVVESSLTLTKEASVNGGAFNSAPFTIEAVDTVTYRLQVQNTGSSPAYDADVTDVLPSGLTVLGTVANPAATETKAWSEAHPEIGWQITGPLMPGETVTLEYQAKLNTTLVTDDQELTNTATVSAYFGVAESERDEGKKNFAGEDILYREYKGPSAPLTATVALPVLEVSKTPAQPSVLAGEKDSYTIAVHNSGTSVAHEVKVLDTLPAGMTYEAGKATANPATGFSEESVVGNQVTWKIASIGVGESVEIDVPVGVEASVETGSELKNKVAVTAIEQTTPVEAEGPIKVTTSADVEAKKSVLGGATTSVPGADLTYVVAAKNNGGPSVARAVKLTDKLPAGVVIVSASAGCSQSAGTVTCEAGNLNPGQEASFQIVVTVLSGYSGSLANTVRAESTATTGHPATPDPEPKNNEAHVEVSTQPSADLELVKTALTPEVHPGQQASFSLVVTNKGPSDAQEAKLVDMLPAGLTYVSASGASCEAAGQVVTCALGTMTAGSSVTVELITQPVGLGSYTNTATVSSPTPDPNMANNSSEATVKVLPAPIVPPSAAPSVAVTPASGVAASSAAAKRTRVTLRKLVREHEVLPGGRLDYRLIVRNAGAQTAEKLKVCDDLPEQTTVLGRGGGHLAGGRICFTLATLAAGHSHTFTIVLRADSNAHGQIVNHATVTGGNFDPAHARASTPVPKASVSPARENHVTG